MSDSTLTRRGFLGVTGAAGAALAAGSFARADGANDRLAVGIVGAGGRGRDLLKTFFDLGKDHKADLVAVCDLWGRNRERAADAVKQALGTQPKMFNRLEDLLGMQGLDAVLVATPVPLLERADEPGQLPRVPSCPQSVWHQGRISNTATRLSLARQPTSLPTPTSWQHNSPTSFGNRSASAPWYSLDAPPAGCTAACSVPSSVRKWTAARLTRLRKSGPSCNQSWQTRQPKLS
jgi:hypothetical protein